jgi:hypothetical protein
MAVRMQKITKATWTRGQSRLSILAAHPYR